MNKEFLEKMWEVEAHLWVCFSFTTFCFTLFYGCKYWNVKIFRNYFELLPSPWQLHFTVHFSFLFLWRHSTSLWRKVTVRVKPQCFPVSMHTSYSSCQGEPSGETRPWWFPGSLHIVQVSTLRKPQWLMFWDHLFITAFWYLYTWITCI